MADGRAHLCELLDSVADLLIENSAVCDHDHRVEHLIGVIGEPHQLMRQPRDRVRLSRSCRMLNEHAPPRTIRLGVGKQLADDIELVETWEQLIALHPAGLGVATLDDLGVVLDDVRQALRRENVLPEIVGLQSRRDWADCRPRRSNPC